MPHPQHIFDCIIIGAGAAGMMCAARIGQAGKRVALLDHAAKIGESILKFTGRARVFESQDDAVEGILGNQIVAGDIVVIRYEGP